MDKDDDALSEAEQEARFFEYLSQLPAEDQAAFEKIIMWIATERPRDAPPLTEAELEKMLEEVKLENTRRKLGYKDADVLSFKPISGRDDDFSM